MPDGLWAYFHTCLALQFYLGIPHAFVFIASGWTTNFVKDSWRGFLYKKARGLVIPFLVYSLVVILIQDAMGWKSILSLVLEGWGGYALWFIPVLYLTLINARLTLLLSKSKVRLLIVGVKFY